MKSPEEIASFQAESAAAKTGRPVWRMFILALFAGFFIALGGLGSSVASFSVKNVSAARLMNAAVFPVGLMMVLCAGAELFTGNSLLIIGVLERKVRARDMLRNWAVVYAGNFAGSVAVALALRAAGIYGLSGGELARAVAGTAAAKVSLTFCQAFWRGVMCNFLVCISVWASSAADTLGGKIAALYLPIFLFVVCGFEHCVANMYAIPAGILAAKDFAMDFPALGWGAFLLRNLVPVTAGNIVGGAGLVGTLYWAAYLKGKSKNQK